MNKRQRESTAKLLYDLVKLSFTGLAIVGIIQSNKLNLLSLLLGLSLAIIFFTIAYWLERKEDTHE
ncbi:MAG: DUF6722 family protein [Nitrospirota bacterium]